jgi:FkbM family methyltransferase
MQSLYHTRGFWRAGAAPVWHHLHRMVSDPAYRALHRFNRHLRRVPRFTPATVFFGGKPIRLCDGPSFLSAWDEIFVHRIYDLGDLPARPRLVDAGANVGLAALYWRWRYGEIRYLGFEPDPDIAAVCRANLGAWNVQGSLIEVAVGAQAGEACFVRDGADGGRLAGSVSGGGRSEVVVKVVDLREYLDGAIDLLKIDIEGAEAAVLPGLGVAMENVRSLFVEWHCPSDGPSGLGDAVNMLERWGFTVMVQTVSWSDRPFAAARQSGAFRQQLNLYASRR